MKPILAKVNNVKKTIQALGVQLDRDKAMPGMCLLWGQTGTGKTETALWASIKQNGVFLRALADWNRSTMLRHIAAGLEIASVDRLGDLVTHIATVAQSERKILFIDESDRLCKKRDGGYPMLETLRDIHDLSGQPIVLIGEEGMDRKLGLIPRLQRRVTQWVKFELLTLEDVATVADTCCEVRVAEDLLVRILGDSRGLIAYCCLALGQVESKAKKNGWEQISLSQWGDAPFFFGKPGGR